MIKKQFRISTSLRYNLEYNLNNIIFFDIETTGFSHKTSYLYLIGCCYYKNSSFYIIQWFAEDLNDEINLLNSFFEFSKDFKAIIHYNGNSFDIPYILSKCKQHKLNYNFNHLDSIDIYKKILPFKKVLKLENCKLKTIETFLNIKRSDIYSGEELIKVYQSYLGLKKLENLKNNNSDSNITTNKSSNELLLKLLLHNEDDLKGLINIMPIMNYIDLLNSSIHILNTRHHDGNVIIKFDFNTTLPIPIQYNNCHFELESHGHYGVLSIYTITDELKFFYDNYRDYYYLPMEDVSIHKSIASFVDKEYKEKAKPSTCYTKKKSTFIPQLHPVISPSFSYHYNDKISYLELTEELLSNNSILEIYVQDLIQSIIHI